MVFVVWIVGGLLSLFGALTYAELAAAMPEAGGEYVYLREAYGLSWGFLYGWTQMWVAKSGSIATLATGFFYYLANFIPSFRTVLLTMPLPIGPGGGPLEIRYGQILAMALILVLGWLNYFGVKLGGNVQVVVTVVKVALILGSSWSACSGAGRTRPTCAAASRPPGGVTGFFAALVGALWAYDGWNNVSMVASEVRRPQRNLPLALIGGVLDRGGYLPGDESGLFLCAAERRSRRQPPRRGRHDENGARAARRRRGQHRGDDFDFRRVERVHSFRLASAVRNGPGRVFLPSGRRESTRNTTRPRRPS